MHPPNAHYALILDRLEQQQTDNQRQRPRDPERRRHWQRVHPPPKAQVDLERIRQGDGQETQPPFEGKAPPEDLVGVFLIHQVEATLDLLAAGRGSGQGVVTW